jgi:hypothetical protein
LKRPRYVINVNLIFFIYFVYIRFCWSRNKCCYKKLKKKLITVYISSFKSSSMVPYNFKYKDLIKVPRMKFGDHKDQWRHIWFYLKNVATWLQNRFWTNIIRIFIFILHFITTTPKILPSKPRTPGALTRKQFWLLNTIVHVLSLSKPQYKIKVHFFSTFQVKIISIRNWIRYAW